MRLFFCALLVLELAGGAAWAQAAEPTVADLVAALKTKDQAARLTAIDYLGLKGEKAVDAVAALIDQLKDESPVVRAHAADALGKIGHKAAGATGPLLKLLGDEDPAVQREAIASLREIKPGPAIGVPAFIKVIENSNPAARQRVLHALAEAGEQAVPALTVALENEKAAYWACLVLRDIGPKAKDAVPALSKAMSDAHPAIRREAILALAAIGVPEAAVPQLVKALDDEATDDAATVALGKFGRAPAAAEAKIRANAKGADIVLAVVSTWALVKLYPADETVKKDAAEVFAKALASDKRNERLAAAKAIIDLKLGYEILKPALAKVREGASEEAIADALRAFAALGEPAVPELIKVLKFEKPRAGVAFILGEMGPQAKDAVDALVGLLTDAKGEVRHEAAIALGKIGPAAKAAVPALVKHIDDPDTAAAYGALYALGRLGPAAIDAKPSLVKALASKDESIRLFAAWSLGQIDPQDKDVAAKIVPVLAGALEDPAPRYRMQAARTLGSLGAAAKPAIEALKKAAHDEDNDVRQAAADALKALGG